MNFKRYIYLKEQEAINHEVEAVKEYNLIKKFESLIEECPEDEVTPEKYPFLKNIKTYNKPILLYQAKIVFLPNLKVSSSWIDVREAKTVSFPSLQTSDIIDARRATSIFLPKLQKCSEIHASPNVKKIVIPKELQANVLGLYPDSGNPFIYPEDSKDEL